MLVRNRVYLFHFTNLFRDDRKNEVAFVIRERKPHLIGLQEALDVQLLDLLNLLPEYDYVGVGRDDGKRGGEYSPILFLRNRFKVCFELFILSSI